MRSYFYFSRDFLAPVFRPRYGSFGYFRNRADYADEKQPEIEIKELASILKKDKLFQEYLDNNRRKVQSAFQLPDLYPGLHRRF